MPRTQLAAAISLLLVVGCSPTRRDAMIDSADGLDFVAVDCQEPGLSSERGRSVEECIASIEDEIKACRAEMRERLPYFVDEHELRYLLSELSWCRAVAYTIQRSSPDELARARAERFAAWKKNPATWKHPESQLGR